MNYKFVHLVVILSVVVLSAGCATTKKEKQVLHSLDRPVDCSTAANDIQVLEKEKVRVSQEVVEGATAIIPVGAVISILTGQEGTKLKVAFGDYNKAIDKRIALIKSECDIK